MKQVNAVANPLAGRPSSGACVSIVSAFVLCGALAAWGANEPDWDYRLEYVRIASGSYFDTGCRPGNQPSVHIACSATTYTIDVFGTPAAEDGCFIYNFDHNNYFLRYGTANNSGSFGSFVYDDYYEIDVPVNVDGSNQVVVDGEAIKGVDTSVVFVDKNITIPGKRYLGEMKLHSFVLSNGGVKTCELIPCMKNGEAMLYDTVSERYLQPAVGTVTAGPAVPDGAVTAPWDRRVGSVVIPKSCYFNTGYVFKDNPCAEIKMATTGSAIDLVLDIFGNATRQNGCFILNVDHGPFYLRYGTSGNTGAKQPNIDSRTVCTLKMDATGLYRNGAKHSDTTGPTTAFNGNTQPMCFPGPGYQAGEQVFYFKFSDGGMLRRDMWPCVKNGVVGFYDFVGEQFYTMTGSGTATAKGTAPFGAYLVGRRRTAASGESWTTGWADTISTKFSTTVLTNELETVASGATYVIALDGDCGSGCLDCPGTGTLSFTGTGTATFGAIRAENALHLALAEGVTLRAHVCVRDGVALARGLYTSENADWITGDGKLIVAGGAGRGFPSVEPTPSGDGWYEFGLPSANGGAYGYGIGYPNSSSSFHWIAGEWPKWDDYLFPVGAKLRLVGYVILDTIPAGLFSEVDSSGLEYVLLHGQTAFADGSTLEVPSGAIVRYQPGSWLESNGKYWLLADNVSLPYDGVLKVDGSLRFYGDGTHLDRQTFTGRLSGSGDIYLHNFSNQGRFRGAFDYTGSFGTGDSFQNGNAIWIDTHSVSGHITSGYLCACSGSFATDPQYCASGLLFGADNSAEPADHELRIDQLIGRGRDNTESGGKRWRQGGNLIVWGSNTVHVGTLSDGLHVVARRQDQNCSNGFLSSANCKGNGYLVVDTFQSGTLYASTNIYLTVGTMASDTVVDYTFQSGAVNRTTLDVTNACSGSTTVKATDLAMLPARLSGFAGSVQLTGTDARSYTIPVDFAHGTDCLYQTVGCIGSGRLTAAPSTGSIDATFPADVQPVVGKYALARFSSGGALLANWTVTLNGAAVDKQPLNGMVLTVVKDATGLWLDVKKSGLWITFR